VFAEEQLVQPAEERQIRHRHSIRPGAPGGVFALGGEPHPALVELDPADVGEQLKRDAQAPPVALQRGQFEPGRAGEGIEELSALRAARPGSDPGHPPGARRPLQPGAQDAGVKLILQRHHHGSEQVALESQPQTLGHAGVDARIARQPPAAGVAVAQCLELGSAGRRLMRAEEVARHLLRHRREAHDSLRRVCSGGDAVLEQPRELVARARQRHARAFHRAARLPIEPAQHSEGPQHDVQVGEIGAEALRQELHAVALGPALRQVGPYPAPCQAVPELHAADAVRVQRQLAQEVLLRGALGVPGQGGAAQARLRARLRCGFSGASRRSRLEAHERPRVHRSLLGSPKHRADDGRRDPSMRLRRQRRQSWHTLRTGLTTDTGRATAEQRQFSRPAALVVLPGAELPKC